MNTLPIEWLASALRANARGRYAAEAAVELLIAHGTWLGRADFLNTLVEYGDDFGGTIPTTAWITWEAVPAFLKRAGCSASEARILRLATELWGVSTGVALDENLSQLDDTNAQIVGDAITHVLTHGGRR